MTTKETLPCGCIAETIGDAFVFTPCSEECEYYKYVLEESERQSKPVIKIRES